jgi:hypothetical protein
MTRLEKDVLIPFDLHTKGKCDNCRKSIRAVFDKADALSQENEIEYISFKTYSTFMHDTLSGLENMAVESQTEEDYSFYASLAAKLVKEWMLFGVDIMNMAVDPRNSAIRSDLFKAWVTVNSELKSLVDHYISSHKILFDMGAPPPSDEILRGYAEGHNLHECE